jgi:hypothetical protein
VLLFDLLVLVLLYLGLVFWILIWVLVLQLWALKILVQLSHQNLKQNEQTSTVWEHFTKLESSDPDDHKSQCNYCKREFNCHPRSHGTSSMLQHIRKRCKKYPGRFDKTQSKLSFEAKREGQAAVGEGSSGNLVIAKFNASKIRAAISRMIIVDELPFRFVEGEGFQDFMKTAEPRFSIPSRFTMMRDCFKLFMNS